MSYRVSVKHVEAKIDRANNLLGLGDDNSGFSRKLGSLRLYGDQAGYKVHQLCNEQGGVHALSSSGTKRETADFLDGLIEGIHLARIADQKG